MPTKKLLSIDIGNRYIKILDVTKKKDEVAVHNATLLNTPENSYYDGQLLDKNALAKVINEYLKKNKIKNKNAIFSIISSKIITRIVDLPKVKKNDLDKLIKVNSVEYFPVNLDEYLLSYNILGEVDTSEGKKYSVYLIAVPENIVEEYYKLCDLCGLKINIIDYKGNGILNFVDKLRIKEDCIVLDLGYQLTSVSIFSKGILKLNRTLNVGTDLICDKVADYFQVSLEEAENTLCKEQLIFFDDNDISKSKDEYLSQEINNALNQILDGIAKVIDYYRSKNLDISLKQIYVIGQGANCQGISTYIEKMFNLKTIELSDFKFVNNKIKEYRDREIYFGVVLGACFSELKILPRSVVEMEESRKKTRLMIEIAALLVVVMIYITYIPYNKITTFEKKKIQLNEKIAKVQEINDINGTLNQLQNRLDFRNSILKMASNNTEQLLPILKNMEKNMPKEIFYLSLRCSENQIDINGIARDDMVVAKLIQNLKKIEQFKDVFVPSITEQNIGIEGKEKFKSFFVKCLFKSEKGD